VKEFEKGKYYFVESLKKPRLMHVYKVVDCDRTFATIERFYSNEPQRLPIEIGHDGQYVTFVDDTHGELSLSAGDEWTMPSENFRHG